jgi:hypothetical protein
MGGLVIRSACHLAAQQGLDWLRGCALVFLGTPHHGAPLERGGHLVDRLLGISPYVGALRAAGPVAQRRHHRPALRQPAGRPTGDDRDAQDQRHDDRPADAAARAGVKTCLVAATTSETASGLRHHLIGDGLVFLSSALGEHRDPALALAVPEALTLVVTSANHWDLLDRAEVTD